MIVDRISAMMKRQRRRRRQRGIALISVLWVVALLSLMAKSFITESRTETQLTRNHIDNATARVLADGGVHRAIARVRQQLKISEAVFDGRRMRVPADGGTLHVAIQDESGKIDLNAAPDALVEQLFASAGAEPEVSSALTDAIADWRDGDSLRRLNGAEDTAYRQADKPYQAKDGPFASVEELRLVHGMTPMLFTQVAPALTVYSGKRGVDLRVAPPIVLRALAPGTDDVAVFLDARSQADKASLNSAMEILNAPRRFLSSSARATFTIRAEAQTDTGGAFIREAVVRVANRGDRPYAILLWRRGR